MSHKEIQRLSDYGYCLFALLKLPNHAKTFHDNSYPDETHSQLMDPDKTF